MTATVEPPVEAKPKKPLFGKKEKRTVLDPLWDDNPISLQVLGICSALAVTIKLEQTLFMCGAVIFVLCMSNVIISLLRNLIPNNIGDSQLDHPGPCRKIVTASRAMSEIRDRIPDDVWMS